jgi:uncharacterized Zn finger protein (UPF0148 family)
VLLDLSHNLKNKKEEVKMENAKSNAETMIFNNCGKRTEKDLFCPVCNKDIKQKTLEEHARRIHKGDAAIKRALAGDKLATPKNTTSAKVKKNQARKSLIESIRAEKAKICKDRVKDRIAERRTLESSIVQNKQILEYLKKNPCDNVMGKFGVPQDKYRSNFCGSKTMEYDTWRKAHKIR